MSPPNAERRASPSLRVALVSPRLPYSKTWESLFDPLGLLSLAHVAAGAGHTVRLFDQAVPRHARSPDLVRAVAAFEPDVVGFQATTPEFPLALEQAAAFKACSPRTPVVFGGWHVSSDAGAIEAPEIDFVVRGEGERPFVALLAALGGGARSFEDVAGLTWKDARGDVRRSPDGGRVLDLDALGVPSRDLLEPGTYHWLGFADPRPRTQRFFTVSTSRGCPYQCIFCQTPTVRGKKWSKRDVTRAVDEVQMLRDRHGANFVCFIDEEFSLDPRRVEAICDELRSRRLDVLWFATARATDVSPRLARIMRAAGCCAVNVGVETGSDEGLARVKKRTTCAVVRAAVNALVDADIQVLGSAIIGFPWETRADLDESLNFFRTLPLDVLGLNFCTPFPGTEVRAMADAEGLIFDHDLRHWTCDRPVMRTRHLGAVELAGYFGRIQRAYYTGPMFWRRAAQLIARRPARLLSIAETVLSSARHGGLRTRFGGARERLRARLLHA
jgi:radical SAM superfamily enzyme YgiQ (UPF0313 family)